MKSVVEWLDATAVRYPNKVGFSDVGKQESFYELLHNAKSIGSCLLKYGTKRPIVIFMDKCCGCIEAMFGAMYAGDYYVVVDIRSPKERIQAIVDTLDYPLFLVDGGHQELARDITVSGIKACVDYEKSIANEIDDGLLLNVRKNMIDMDPAYILFTSGSTGIPKGTVVNHRSLMAYINWVSEEFKFDSETVFGSQTPFYFSMSVTDIFSTVKCGCSFHIIPKEHFMFPLTLIDFLNDKKINTLYWVPTAISFIANWKAFDFVKPKFIRKVLFAGEVMPTKQLNYWIHNLENVQFANLFGPTETTDICTYYVVDRAFADDEVLPIGKHCDNCDTFVIKEDGGEATKKGEEGELYVRSSFVAYGYYNNPEKTAASFIQNPLNKAYPEIVYKTGDIVRISENSELVYVSRKDFQIKRNGYRIELGEIEAAANSVDKVKNCVCIYCKESNQIILLFEGRKNDGEEIRSIVKQRVPQYMYPDKVLCVKKLPLNQNGKIDRNYIGSHLNEYEN